MYDSDDHPKRFKMGTPNEIWSTMERCWEVEPTSERIIEDILALPQILEKIIAANGCVVHDLFLRNSRRHRRADGKGDCDRKPCRKQRIATNIARPCHPDCYDALAQLTRINRLRGIVAEVDVQIEAAQAAGEQLENNDNVYIHAHYAWIELNEGLEFMNIEDLY
jgi:hypothetical protein